MSSKVVEELENAIAYMDNAPHARFDRENVMAFATSLLEIARHDNLLDRALQSLPAGILAELGDCEEVLISISPCEQLDAKEPRSKVTITGPTKLLSRLMDAVAPGGG